MAKTETRYERRADPYSSQYILLLYVSTSFFWKWKTEKNLKVMIRNEKLLFFILLSSFFALMNIFLAICISSPCKNVNLQTAQHGNFFS